MNHITFFTATILCWKHLLSDNKYKDIITDSMKFLVEDERVRIFAFVIMPNHMHLVWRVRNGKIYEDVQRDFLKYTAQQIKLDLESNHPDNLREFYVGAKDRKYQFWERNPLSVELYSQKVIEQKINYIHFNPISEKWKLCKYITDYKYSSASFYWMESEEWDFLTHYAAAVDD
ncbi:MAG: transposase [Ignavibacteriae bacterium]|nr:MAG: transposase [Ignavibacteriota bacterium]